MEEYGPTSSRSSGGSRRARRRLGQYDDRTDMTPSTSTAIAAAVERRLDERLPTVCSAIEQQATELMREIAGEVWRARAPTGVPSRSASSRSCRAIRRSSSLLASSDERFQSLAVRSARLEDSLTELATRVAPRARRCERIRRVGAIAESPTPPRSTGSTRSARSSNRSSTHRGGLRALRRARPGDHRERAAAGARPRRPDRAGDGAHQRSDAELRPERRRGDGDPGAAGRAARRGVRHARRHDRRVTWARGWRRDPRPSASSSSC